MFDSKCIPKLVRLLLATHRALALGKVMKNVLTFATIAVGVLMVSAPAFAGADGISVPEPVSMSLLAGGIVAIAAVRRMRGKQ